MKMMPRRRITRVVRSLPSFMDQEFGGTKRTLRAETARLIKAHVKRTDPDVFCMPYYDALCVKAINAELPDATFVGCEQVYHVAEMFAEAAPGKKIEVRRGRIADYVKKDIDLNRFDAAFLDYMGTYNKERLDEITGFIKTKMLKHFVIAVTLQGDLDDVQRLTHGLSSSMRQIKRIFAQAYMTKTQMCHSIYVGSS